MKDNNVGPNLFGALQAVGGLPALQLAVGGEERDHGANQERRTNSGQHTSTDRSRVSALGLEEHFKRFSGGCFGTAHTCRAVFCLNVLLKEFQSSPKFLWQLVAELFLALAVHHFRRIGGIRLDSVMKTNPVQP